jgi:hypothetical protein
VGWGTRDQNSSARPALISVQAKLFEDLREQTCPHQVSIAKKSQAQSPLPFVDAATAPEPEQWRIA